MKTFLAVLLLSLAAYATTPVSGHIQTLGTTPVTSNAFVRFWLRGCAGNQPVINGSAVIAPSQGGVFYFDLAAASDGSVSGTLYSTRDATGLLGGDISCGGSSTAVWYGMQIWSGGKSGPEVPVAALNGVTLDPSTVTPLISTPPPNAPAGYAIPNGSASELQARNGPAALQALSGSSVSGANLTLGGNGSFLIASPQIADFSGAAGSIPWLVGLNANKPATCTVGQSYFATDASAGANLYGCSATNTWSVETGGGGGGSLSGGTSGFVTKWSGASSVVADSSLQNLGASWQFTLPISFSTIGSTTPVFSGIPSNAAVVPNLNSNFLQGATWASPASIGTTLPAAEIHGVSGFFTSIQLSGGGDVDLKAIGLATELSNDAGTGTTANEAVCVNSSGNAVNCANGASAGIIGICDTRDSGSTCGTSGTAHVVTQGQVNAVFDSASAITAGDFIGVSAASAPKLTDLGASCPTAQQAVGMALASGAAGSTLNVLVFPQSSPCKLGTTGSPANGNLAAFSGTNSVTNTDLSGAVSTSGTAVTSLGSKFLHKDCEIHIWGTGAASVLQDTDDEPASCYNGTGATLTITGVLCWANATGGGGPTVTPILTGGAANSILTGALTCGNATFASGTLNGTPTQANGTTLDDNITTAGGTATNIRIIVLRTLPNQ